MSAHQSCCVGRRQIHKIIQFLKLLQCLSWKCWKINTRKVTTFSDHHHLHILPNTINAPLEVFQSLQNQFLHGCNQHSNYQYFQSLNIENSSSTLTTESFLKSNKKVTKSCGIRMETCRSLELRILWKYFDGSRPLGTFVFQECIYHVH